MDEDQDAIRQELRRFLAPPIPTVQLAYEIAMLLKSFGRTVDPRVAAKRLAEHVASRFTCKSEALQRLIQYRPKELANLVHQAANLAHQAAREDFLESIVLPMIAAQKKVRRKINTQKERVLRSKQAKNRYEHLERNYIRKPGAIEREFSARSGLGSLYPFPGHRPVSGRDFPWREVPNVWCGRLLAMAVWAKQKKAFYGQTSDHKGTGNFL